MFFFKKKENKIEKQIDTLIDKLQSIEMKLPSSSSNQTIQNDHIILLLKKLEQLALPKPYKDTQLDILLIKLQAMEHQIMNLSKEITQLNHGTVKEETSSNVFIDNLTIESFIVDGLEYINNIGQLGIHDLSGKLNIGTSLEGRLPKKQLLKFHKFEEKQSAREDKFAKVQMRARAEKDEQKK
ncbi:hypothetical protein ACE38V_04930 [Cytobacillus sp. Hz8]|uniref:hypothetical protein n=1 Tax=Cytobacillus sp. Hz8 TaxID=3347168 RepID=UPI0035D6869A